jgi:hypothetical protein
MDRSGAMPRSAWVEIRDRDGKLLMTVAARIKGGAVSAELPTFPPQTYGTIQLCTDEGGETDPTELEIKELPTSPQMLVVQMG